MSLNLILVIFGWIFAVAIFFAFIVLLRYLEHRERMEMIKNGLNPDSRRRNRGILRAGLITMMVGLALTVGLYPLGFFLPSQITNTPLHMGPWLLPGLIPLGVGLALTVSYYLEQSSQPPNDTPKEQNVIDIDARRNRSEPL